MKIIKIERGNYCYFFRYREGRFKCCNPKAVIENGNFRIINRKLAFSGKFPSWCPLEDYKEADHA